MLSCINIYLFRLLFACFIYFLCFLFTMFSPRFWEPFDSLLLFCLSNCVLDNFMMIFRSDYLNCIVMAITHLQRVVLYAHLIYLINITINFLTTVSQMDQLEEPSHPVWSSFMFSRSTKFKSYGDYCVVYYVQKYLSNTHEILKEYWLVCTNITRPWLDKDITLWITYLMANWFISSLLFFNIIYIKQCYITD